MSLMKADSQSLSWRKARRSMANGNCVEVCRVDGEIVVRDSKNPSGSVLVVPASSWRAFTAAAGHGHFDVERQ